MKTGNEQIPLLFLDNDRDFPTPYIFLQIELRNEYYTKFKIREKFQAIFDLVSLDKIYLEKGEGAEGTNERFERSL